jgi:hypothetical protein
VTRSQQVLDHPKHPSALQLAAEILDVEVRVGLLRRLDRCWR